MIPVFGVVFCWRLFFVEISYIVIDPTPIPSLARHGTVGTSRRPDSALGYNSYTPQVFHIEFTT